jgi:hypothetical protein
LDPLKVIINDNAWYRIYIPGDKMLLNSIANISLWQELITVLLKKYIEQFYLYFKNKFNAEHIEAKKLYHNDDNLISEYDIRINRNEGVEEEEAKFLTLSQQMKSNEFNFGVLAPELDTFDIKFHLYKPLIYLGKGYANKIQVVPVALNNTETRFVKDFETKIGAIQEEKKFDEIYLLRNQSRKGIGFFAEGNNFYPDFMLWIKKDGKQYLSFIDPKGIRNSKGINDPKIQFYKYLKNLIEPQVSNSGLVLNSFIISNTKWIEVNWKGDLSIADFNDQNVLFQEDQIDLYISIMIDKILN